MIHWHDMVIKKAHQAIFFLIQLRLRISTITLKYLHKCYRKYISIILSSVPWRWTGGKETMRHLWTGLCSPLSAGSIVKSRAVAIPGGDPSCQNTFYSAHVVVRGSLCQILDWLPKKINMLCTFLITVSICRDHVRLMVTIDAFGFERMIHPYNCYVSLYTELYIWSWNRNKLFTYFRWNGCSWKFYSI